VYEVVEHSFHRLAESRWGIGQAKEHYIGFVCAKWSFEGSFPPILFFDLDVIETPSQVYFREQCLPLEFIDDAPNKREWVYVSYSQGVQGSVVNYWM
jgi:hypothetical protein